MKIEAKTFSSHSEKETEDFGRQLAKTLPCGTLLALYGDLGAGKTVFTRGFAAGLGITEPISSPTYTILQEYPLQCGGYLYHLDLYRIADEAAALAFGADEFLEDPASYKILEWPERIEGLLGPETVRIRISHVDDATRRIEVLG